MNIQNDKISTGTWLLQYRHSQESKYYMPFIKLCTVIHTFSSSEFIDSINAQNSFLYLVMRSSLLAGHVPICCFRASLCALMFAQWNRMWSIDWCSLPHLHVGSSLRWNRRKYAFVIPCPVSTAVIFGVNFILDLSLAWAVGKYCLVAAAVW